MSGGACGCAPAGAPTCWNSESAAGQVDDAVDAHPAGGSPARADRDGVAGRACRLAAVCWASSTPVPRPASVAQLPGERARVAVGQPEHAAGPGAAASSRRRWPRARWCARSRPAARARRRGGAGPGASTSRGRGAGLRLDLPVDGHLRRSARWVICDVVADRKVPIDASSATPTATPAAVATRRRRRCASRPRSQISATMPASSTAWSAGRRASPSARRGARRRPGRASRRRARRRRASAAASSTSTTARAVGAVELPVGSSARISRGSPASARATATRCAWPPEISSGSLSASSSEVRAASSAARRAPAGLGVGRAGRAPAAARRSRPRSAAAAGSGPGRRRRRARAAGRARRRSPARSRSRRSGRRARPEVQQRRLARAGRPDERDPVAGARPRSRSAGARRSRSAPVP